MFSLELTDQTYPILCVLFSSQQLWNESLNNDGQQLWNESLNNDGQQLWNESLNNDGQQFHQYQQNVKSDFTSAPGLEQVQNCDGVEQLNRITEPLFENRISNGNTYINTR